MLAPGIENDKIGVAAHSNRPLARIQSKQLRRRRRDKFDKAVHAESPAGYTTGVDQAHAMLHAWAAVGNLGEVVFAQFFLFFEAEWAVVSGNDLQMNPLQSIPQFFLMPLLAQRRSENIFRAFKSGRIHVLERQI